MAHNRMDLSSELLAKRGLRSNLKTLRSIETQSPQQREEGSGLPRSTGPLTAR